MIHIDLTDFVANTLWGGNVTGIQRFQFEIFNRIIMLKGYRAFSFYAATWVDVSDLLKRSDTAEELQVKVSQYYEELGLADSRIGRFSYRRLIRKCRKTIALTLGTFKVSKILNEGDFLFVASAAWRIPDQMRLYSSKAAQRATVVSFIYDLRDLTHPDYCEEKDRMFIGQFLSYPSSFICLSAFTASALSQWMLLNRPDRNAECLVSMPAHAFPNVARNLRIDKKGSNKKRLGISGPYVLCISSFEQHKNQLTLVKIWKELISEYGDFPALVCAGRCNTAYGRTIASLAEGSEKILIVDRPDDDTLTALYSDCLFTVFPSLSEGWGIPVGESLWFGKACAASSRESIPEVGGDLCIYFDPEDHVAFKQALIKLNNLNIREKFEKAIMSSSLRTWDDAADDLERKIHHLIAGRLRRG